MRLQPVSQHGRGKGVQQQRGFRHSTAIMTILFCVLAVSLSACTKYHISHSGSGSPDQTPVVKESPTVAVTPTPTPKPIKITLNVVGCPAGLSINWDQVVGTQPNVNKVQTVTCGGLEGGALAALVNVRYYSSDAKMDFYVYDNLYGTPAQRFKVQGLINGDAQISPQGTIITAEAGPRDPVVGARDVFKEYQWNGATFQQVLFPGIYPDATHYQAEQSQATYNAAVAQGSTSENWRAQFTAVPAMMAKKLFHWDPVNIHVATVSYHTSSATFIASVTNSGPGGGGFVATMFHLDSNLDTQIFEISRVTALDGTTLLSNPMTGQQLTSPVNANGNATASNGTMGHVVLLMDTYTSIGDSGPLPGTGSGVVGFAKAVPYKLNGPGVQEGIVAFYSTTQNNINIISEVVMVKVLFSN
jgi:hypothetical protein